MTCKKQLKQIEPLVILGGNLKNMPENKFDRPAIKPAPLNDLQRQALTDELFGHPSERRRFVRPLKPQEEAPMGVILEFRPRQTEG